MNSMEFLKTKLLFYIGALVLGLAFITLGIYFYWLIYPTDVLEVKKLPVPVSRVPTKPGEIITLSFNYCKHIDVEGKIEMTMISSSTAILLPPQAETTKKQCNENLTGLIIIPSQASAGTYHFHYKITYPVNPTRDIVEEFDTEKFQVIE